MNKIYLPAFGLALSMIFVAPAICSAVPTDPKACDHAITGKIGSAPAIVALAKAGFALDLIIHAKAQAGNISVSPFGLASVIAGLDLGADARTNAAIAELLHVGAKSRLSINSYRYDSRRLSRAEVTASSPLSSANAFFYDGQLKLNGDIASSIAAESGFAVSAVDFADPKTIDRVNRWVSTGTGGAVPEIIEPGFSASLAAINAFHFSDCWKYRFDPDFTKERAFHTLDGRDTPVATMALDTTTIGNNARLAVRQKGRFIAVELPYADPRFVLDMVTTTDKPAERSEFRSSTGLLAGIKFKPSDVRLTLPAFDDTASIDALTDFDLPKLGIIVNSSKAFSGIAEGIQLSTIVQKLVLKVDERGTEAAAATAAIAVRGAQILKPAKTIAFDKPFIFAIRHKETGAVLISGYVAEPHVTKTEVR
ncbi:MAG: serpin family protein [Proteobacteria bacterium]|nr:serpin family protein [Pseudomonadota bacterium]